jgi:hypothetical protein
MPEAEFKYDVAISFLVQDINLATALYQKLMPGLKVFFFPRNQEDLAGTNGLESMRQPFLVESRLNVVLYRERWGNTPWTGVEAVAIQESCLQNSFSNIFMFVVEPTNVVPKWLPTTHVYFNYGEFSLDDAVGAIKGRVVERGGHYQPMTPARRAELLEAENEFRRQRSMIDTPQGAEKVLDQVSALFEALQEHCAEIDGRLGGQIRYGMDFRRWQIFPTFTVTDGFVTLNVTWEPMPYEDGINRNGLYVGEFNGALAIPGEAQKMYFYKPERLKVTKYEPDLSRALEYGWKVVKSEEFISTPVLASNCAIRFLDLVEKRRNGGIKPLGR